MLEALRMAVYEANLELPRRGLITYTWGNVSARDPDSGYIAIKPSGVPNEDMRPQDIVVCGLSGAVIHGSLRPSSDLPSHLELYARYPQLGGIVHTHSPAATAWAQAGRSIPYYGTTHADYFYGDIPCTRQLTPEEIAHDYERNAGRVIVETLETLSLEPLAMPATLCISHGAFTWGRDAAEAVHNAVVLEELARMAMWTEAINPQLQRAPQEMLDKHYSRKHGKDAYYGQAPTKKTT